MNLDQWARLDKMATLAPVNLASVQWLDLIQYAQEQLGKDKSQDVYWERKLASYQQGVAQEANHDTGEAPTPADPVQAARKKLMQDFGIEEMDAPTVLLVEMLIRQISSKMFEPAQVGESDRERLDKEMFGYVRQLVEQEDKELTEAYKLTDARFEQPPSSTQKRFSRLSKKEWDNAGWGLIDGEIVAVKEQHGTPMHPEICEFLKKYGKPRKKKTT